MIREKKRFDLCVDCIKYNKESGEENNKCQARQRIFVIYLMWNISRVVVVIIGK